MSIRESLLSVQSQSKKLLNNGILLLSDHNFKPFIQSYELLYSSFPNVISMIGNFVISFFTMAVISKLYNNDYVAGYGLGKTILNCFQQALISSFNIGLCTQQAHAFGAKNYQLVGVLLQRAWVTGSIIILSTIPFIINLKSILIYCNVKEEISIIASDFVIYMLPTGFLSLLFNSLKQYLIASKQFKIIMFTSNFCYGLSPLYIYIYLYIFDLKILGVALVFFTAQFLGSIILIKYIKNDIKQHQENSVYFYSWIPFTKETLEIIPGLQYFIKSAIIGASNFLEWIFLEIMTLYVIALNNEYSLSAQVCFTGAFISLFFLPPFAISFTVNSFVGNMVGENRPKIVKNIIKIINISTLIYLVSFYILGQLLKPYFVNQLATGPQMKYYLELIYNTYLNSHFFTDTYQIILQAVMRSLGLEKFATISFILIYYIIGLPLTYILVFNLQIDIQGIYYSLFIVSGLVVILFQYKIYHLDYQQTCLEISERQKFQDENTSTNEDNYEYQNLDFKNNKYNKKQNLNKDIELQKIKK